MEYASLRLRAFEVNLVVLFGLARLGGEAVALIGPWGAFSLGSSPKTTKTPWIRAFSAEKDLRRVVTLW